MNIAEMLFGQTGQHSKQTTLTGGQNDFLTQLLTMLGQQGGEGGGMQNAMGLLEQYLDPNSEVYKNFEKPYMQQFEQQTIPQLAEQFAGMGGGMGGGGSSSGFGQALGAAGSNLQTQLAQMKSGMQRQAITDMFGQYNQMANQALGTKAYENTYKPSSAGLVPTMLAGFAQGAGSKMASWGG